MKCLTCNGQRVTWSKDKFGCSTCKPCAACNKNGQAVKKETEKFNQLYRTLLTNQVRSVANG